jgi:hypothetical protein
MRPRVTVAITLAVGLLGATSIAWACGHCIRDILSPAEFDRRAWDASNVVFVGIVVATTSSRADEFSLEIDYRLDVEEVLKGTAEDFDERIYTRRSVSEWEIGVAEIACGETLINTGDRLLVFSSSEGAISVGRCSSTRVIDGQAAASRAEVQETLTRLRRWRDAG